MSIMPLDDPSFFDEVWKEYRPFLLSRVVDALRFLTLLSFILVVHLAQVYAISRGFSPVFVRWLNYAEEAAAFSGVMAFLVESTLSLIFSLRLSKGIGG